MMKKVLELELNTIHYNWANYSDLDMRESDHKEQMILYAKQALSDVNVKEELKSKTALGQIFWGS